MGDGPIDLLVETRSWLPIDLMWDEPRLVRFLERLSSICRHMWFDPRGRGASDPVPHDEERLAESIVDDMVALLDAVGWAPTSCWRLPSCRSSSRSVVRSL
jgi:pimeloyl-ACP methyl ester carboxylesterase